MNGKSVRINADREVILAAGAFNTPQLLMLSGWPSRSPAGGWRDAQRDLPVGRNLQDHIAVTIMFDRAGENRRSVDRCRVDRMVRAMVQCYLFGTGTGAVVPGGLHAFIKTTPSLDCADIEIHVPRPADPRQPVVSGPEGTLQGRIRHQAVSASS